MLLIYCLLLPPIFAGVLVIGRCFVIAVLNGISLNAINLLRKSELIALSSSQCREAISNSVSLPHAAMGWPAVCA